MRDSEWDRVLWATWYDLPNDGADEYLAWLHTVHLPAMLERTGYLWAAHVQNIMSPEREQQSNTTKTSDASVPTGNAYLLLFGAAAVSTFVDPTPAELHAGLPARDRALLDRRVGARSCIFLEVARVDGPDVDKRSPGLTPGPIIQCGSFNVNSPANEPEVAAWYARDRLPLTTTIANCVGARELVSVAGWAKHGVLYEFSS
ncbi:MAG: hypothetical protein J2P17_28305, partial [Mycobacterium sp.]|nr:hypothetical protein [Mycobacterium sp.]